MAIIKIQRSSIQNLLSIATYIWISRLLWHQQTNCLSTLQSLEIIHYWLNLWFQLSMQKQFLQFLLELSLQTKPKLVKCSWPNLSPQILCLYKLWIPYHLFPSIGSILGQMHTSKKLRNKILMSTNKVQFLLQYVLNSFHSIVFQKYLLLHRLFQALNIKIDLFLFH